MTTLKPIALTGVIRQLKPLANGALQLRIEIDVPHQHDAQKHFSEEGLGVAIARLTLDTTQAQLHQQLMQEVRDE